jgi:hypothetical protein
VVDALDHFDAFIGTGALDLPLQRRPLGWPHWLASRENVNTGDTSLGQSVGVCKYPELSYSYLNKNPTSKSLS